MENERASGDRLPAKRLIVNADDFGFAHGVNEGILLAFQSGVLTSATIMANGQAFDEAAAIARANPRLGVGVHLAIVGGRPVAPLNKVASLVDRSGLLRRTLSDLILELVRGRMNPWEIEIEFNAQIERVLDAGIVPTHVDTHKHSQIVGPVAKALARSANKFGIKRVRFPFEKISDYWLAGDAARANRRVYMKQFLQASTTAYRARSFKKLAARAGLKTPDRFFGVSLTGLLDSAAMINVVRMIGAGTSELMCHPAVHDDSLERAATRLKSQRQRELDALTDPRVRDAMRENRIELISFRELD